MTVNKKTKNEELNNKKQEVEEKQDIKSSKDLTTEETNVTSQSNQNQVQEQKQEQVQKQEQKKVQVQEPKPKLEEKTEEEHAQKQEQKKVQVQNQEPELEEKSEEEQAQKQDQKLEKEPEIDSEEKQNEDSAKDNQFEISNSQTENTKKTNHKFFKLFQNIVLTFIAILVLAFTVFTIANTDNSTISSGISIWGVDVSKLDKDAAIEKLSNFVQENLENDILLKHNEFETNIGLEQLETKVKVSAAVDAAFEAGSGSNIFSNSFTKLSLILKPVDIKPTLSINTEELEKTLNDISTQLPDAVKQSDYYIDGNNLIITSGKPGVVVNTETMSKIIIEKINDLSYINNPLELDTLPKDPDAPNIDEIYNEIHKEAIDAHYDSATRIVYPEENGLDFKISLDEAKNMLTVAQEEYTIPLKVLRPNVTTNMIGMEAFPELLSTFSTKYPSSNAGRTTNLKLAAGKVNGTVVLPGQTFSYNAVVGERTIAAGYKEAAIYQDGQVVNGLGGGICQISTTLYNAALYANLDIVERRNHQFVPSYIGAGRDATVVYGSQDFKFKNNRNYAIKITCSVEKGIATFNIYGISEPNDYEVVISSAVTSRGANSFTSATYKTLKQNGQTVSSETISRDTYKTH